MTCRAYAYTRVHSIKVSNQIEFSWITMV